MHQRFEGILSNMYLTAVSGRQGKKHARAVEAVAEALPVEILAFADTPRIASEIYDFL